MVTRKKTTKRTAGIKKRIIKTVKTAAKKKIKSKVKSIPGFNKKGNHPLT